MIDLDAWDAFVNGTAMGHDERDALPEYAALGLAGESAELLDLVMAAGAVSASSGRCAELVKKARRKSLPLDVVDAVAELGDVLWYASRFAKKIGVPTGTVLEACEAKLRRRKLKGKDPEAERRLVVEILGRRSAPARQCDWCQARPATVAGYCDEECRAHASGLVG